MSAKSATETTPNSNLAILSLIFGISGWSLLPFVGGVIAIITGHIAKQEIRQSEGELGGDGLATAGLVLGYTCVGFTGLVILILFALAILFIILFTTFIAI